MQASGGKVKGEMRGARRTEREGRQAPEKRREVVGTSLDDPTDSKRSLSHPYAVRPGI